jgi:hypothetical protein
MRSVAPKEVVVVPKVKVPVAPKEAVVAPKVDESVTPKEPAIVADQRYKKIKGIVLKDGKVIEGQIISMNADIVKIRTTDGKVLSYSFINKVEEFISE